MLAPVKEKGFVVFHDAYHYFERRFGVTAAGLGHRQPGCHSRRRTDRPNPGKG